MQVIEHFSKTKRPLVSVEIIPPKRGGNIVDFHAAIESIKPYDIPFINVTSHAAEIEWVETPQGAYRRVVKRKSPGTFGLCAVIKYKYGIDPVPHILCNGFTREETEDALVELNYLGIENVLAIRGDGKPRHLDRSDRSVNENACQLVEQIQHMNQGKYQDFSAAETDFCVGAGCYPEKHFEAPNLHFDIEMLKLKQDLGAQYAVTQMFFDTRHYFAFLEKVRQAGVTIPIIPGLKILTSKRQLSSIPRTFHVEIPEELTERVLAATGRAAVRSVGVEWALAQAIELFNANVPGVHFYIMQNTAPFRQLMDKLRTRL